MWEYLWLLLGAGALGLAQADASEAHPTPPSDIPYLDRFAAHEYRDDRGQRLPYRLLSPKRLEPGERYPLVVILHGVGERGEDNLAPLRNGVAEWFGRDDAREQYPCFYMAPQCPEGMYWSSAKEGVSRPARWTVEAIRSLLAQYPIDRGRLYLTGLSMGGFGVWDLITHYPHAFAAAVIIAGGGQASSASRVVNLPLWLFHGARDDVVSPEYARTIVAALREIGGNVRYTEYPEVGHACWWSAFREPELRAWLFAQRKE